MKVFMTGGAGFIGSRIARLLIDRGDRVTVLVRDSQSVAPAGAEIVVGDLADASLLARSAREADAVMHLALGSGERAPAIDRDAVASIGEALAASGKAFIHTSAAGIVGDTRGRVVNEDVSPEPTPGVRWRYDNERAARELVHRGIRVMVVRPAPIVHDREHPGFLAGALRKAATSESMPFVDGGKRWSAAHVDDVANLYVAALDRGDAGAVFFAASDELVTNRDVAAAIANGLPLRAVRDDEARSIFSFMAELTTIDIMVDAASARRELGWSATHPTLMADLS